MKRYLTIIGLLATLHLAGCTAAAWTAGSVVGNAGVNHTLSGIAYKTFTAPIEDTRVAALQTLKRMQVKLTGYKKTRYGWWIRGTAYERTIDVKLQRVTPATTRMRVNTSMGIIFTDGATSAEIIMQTARRLGNTNSARHWPPSKALP